MFKKKTRERETERERDRGKIVRGYIDRGKRNGFVYVMDSRGKYGTVNHCRYLDNARASLYQMTCVIPLRDGSTTATINIIPTELAPSPLSRKT